MQTTKIRSIGDSLGLIIPKTMLDNMSLDKGDKIHVVPTETGLMLLPYDDGLEESMKAFEVGRRKYRKALKELSNPI